MTPSRRPSWPLAFILFLGCLMACVKVGSYQDTDRQGPPPAVSLSSSQPQVSLVVDAKEAGGFQAQLTMEGVEVSTGQQWVSLLHKPLIVTAEQAARGLLVERSQVPPGRYEQIRYRLSRAVLTEGGREVTLQVPTEPVEFALTKPLLLRDGDSETLFLHWDVAASLAKRPTFTPAIGAVGQQVPLTRDLAYVSCPEIDTVYLVRTDRNRIYGSWGVPGRPTSLKAVAERNLLYVLAADQAMIKAIDLSSGRVKDTIRIPMMARPSFMVIDRQGQSAYLLDEGTDYLLRIDLATGRLAAQGRVGERLDFAVLLEAQGRLAVSSARSHKVLLLDAVSLQVQQTIAVGSTPQGLVSEQQDLYVALERTNMVSWHDLNSGVSRSQPVGQGPSRLLAYDRTLFVANSRGGTVSLLRPQQLTPIKEITVGGAPGEMAVVTDRNWLYIADSAGQGLAVADLTSQRLATRIDLQARPFAIEVIR